MNIILCKWYRQNLLELVIPSLSKLFLPLVSRAQPLWALLLPHCSLSGPSPPRMLGPPYMSDLGMREVPWLPLGPLLYLFDLSQSYSTA